MIELKHNPICANSPCSCTLEAWPSCSFSCSSCWVRSPSCTASTRATRTPTSRPGSAPAAATAPLGSPPWRSGRSEWSGSAPWVPESRSSASRPGSRPSGREVTAELGEAARDRIAHFLTRKVEKGTLAQADRDAAVERLALTTDVADLADCDLVIEAIVEELEPKRELFAELDRPDRTRRRARDEHVGALGDRDRRGDRAARARRRHALLQPGAADAARRDRPRRADRRRARSRRRSRSASASARRRSAPRHARIRRQPRPDPAPERLHPRPRRVAGHAPRTSTRG